MKKYYVPGDIMACPCGWRPASWKAGNGIKETRRREQEAKRHWRECQHVRKWQPSGTDHRRAMGKILGREGGQKSNAAAVQRCQERAAALPAAAKRSMHELDFGVAIKKRRDTCYKCRACSGIYTLTYVFRATCPAVPAEQRLTYEDFVAATGAKCVFRKSARQTACRAAAMSRRLNGKRLAQRSKAD